MRIGTVPEVVVRFRGRLICGDVEKKLQSDFWLVKSESFLSRFLQKIYDLLPYGVFDLQEGAQDWTFVFGVFSGEKSRG
jgi:hypothetical protein